MNRAATLLALALLPTLSFADILTGRVVKVVDGDTVHILSDHTTTKIRLAGIDSPERGQAFGTVCKESLASLLAGKDVEVETHKMDRYQRAVGKVVLDGKDANLEMVRLGCAWHYKQYAKEQSAEDVALYDQAEQGARASRLGLWKDAHPIPPWEYRAAKRK